MGFHLDVHDNLRPSLNVLQDAFNIGVKYTANNCSKFTIVVKFTAINWYYLKKIKTDNFSHCI